MQNHGIPLDRLEEDERRILVVDDDPYYLDIIPTALSRAIKTWVSTGAREYTFHTASTGFDAGAMVAEFTPHLIILDIHLTDMDGRMVCERVKNRPDTRHTRILAISGYLDDAETANLDRHGFDDYLKKPFSMEDLSERVRKLLGESAQSR